MQNIIKRIGSLKLNSRIRLKARAAICGSMTVALLLSGLPGDTYARQGDSGYEGGISSGETPSMTSLTSASKYEFEYQEPVFLTGVPVIMSGKLTLSKKLKEDTKTKTQSLTSTYVYSLKNGTNTLTRNLTFVTTITPKANGQKVESTQLTKATEAVIIDNTTYRIASVADFQLSKSILNDFKPGVNYFSGELIGRKTYRIGTTGSDYIVVESSGSYTGYDQYWSSAEAQVIKQTIQQKRAGKAAVTVGDISIDLSTTTKKELKYADNLTEQSSIAGGYVQTQANESILKYTAVLSELDKKKLPTSKLVTYTNSLKLESFPTPTRLVSPNLSQIRGHASEENIALMFGLEAFNNAEEFDPQEYMSRAEFVDAFIKVSPEVPLDPAFKVKKTTSKTTKNQELTSAYSDVPTSHMFLDSINEAAKRGIVSGSGKSKFRPEDLITVSEAVSIMVNALGLNRLAPNPAPVTSFKDNDKIPSYARGSMYVAEKLGIIAEDAKGYIYPNNKITKAKFADMMKAYIDFMGKDLRKEYTERLISY